MDEIAAKHILLDFEMVALIALVLGVLVYLTLGSFRRRGEPLITHGGTEFDVLDLLLMFFPAMLFLLQPIMAVSISDTTASSPETGAANEENLVMMGANLAYFGFVWVMTYGIIVWIRQRDIVEIFGLKRLSLTKIVIGSIFGTVVSIVACGWYLAGLSESFLSDIFTGLKAQDQVRNLQASNSIPYIIFTALFACVVAPLVEEFLFRGYFYGTVKRFTGPIFSAVVVGALFAVIHGNLPALLPLWGLSILLSATYELSRSLWVPVGIHALFNATNVVVMLTGSPAND